MSKRSKEQIWLEKEKSKEEFLKIYHKVIQNKGNLKPAEFKKLKNTIDKHYKKHKKLADEFLKVA